MASVMINGNGNVICGNSISITNGKIIVDGKNITPENTKTINIEVKGDVQQLQVDCCDRVVISGNVGNAKSGSGDIEITGYCSGNLQTGSGDIECGNVTGSVQTGSGDIKCENIGGDASTMSGDIKRK